MGRRPGGGLLAGHDGLRFHDQEHELHVHHRPEVIKAVTGEEISFEALGGAKTHNEKSGWPTLPVREPTASNRSAAAFLFAFQQYGGSAHRPNRRRPAPYRSGADAIIPDNPTSLTTSGRDPGIVDNGEFFEPHQHYA